MEGHEALPCSRELVTWGTLRLELPSQVFGVVEEFLLENTEFGTPVSVRWRCRGGNLVYWSTIEVDLWDSPIFRSQWPKTTKWVIS